VTTWEKDKEEVLAKLVDIYEKVKYSINRYEASQEIFADFDFFVDKLMGNDSITLMFEVDKEFINGYLTTMSELIGEEK
jgi:hypothetical protein